MIVRRRSDCPPTVNLKTGPTSWVFSPAFSVFSIDDSDVFHVLKRGNFEVVRRDEMETIKPEDVYIVQRFGPSPGRG